jgi:hypothetical protein
LILKGRKYLWSKDSEHILIKEVSDKSTDLKIFNLKEKSLVCALSFLDLHGGIFFHEKDKILIICKEELLVVSDWGWSFRKRPIERLSVRVTHAP